MNKKSYFLMASLIPLLLVGKLNALQIYTVTTPGDSNPLAAGNPGDLRNTLNLINQNPLTDTYEVVFNLPAGSQTINISGQLPVLNLTKPGNTLIINGNNNGNQIVLDGGNTQRGFIARQGDVTIENITVQNTVATGGDGGESLGGGG